MKAIDYNKKKAPEKIYCQVRQELILPGTEEGVEWVKWAQKSLALKADGMFGPTTKKKFEKRYGKISEKSETLHPMPQISFLPNWNYDHLHVMGQEPWPHDDKQWEEVTSPKNAVAGLLRLVSGYDPSNRTTSRGPDSLVTLDTCSIGITHEWSRSIPKYIKKLSDAHPEIADWAWGDAFPHDDRRAMENIFDAARGRHPHYARLRHFSAGWFAVARHPSVVAFQCDYWFKKFAPTALRTIRRFGWSKYLTRDCGGQVFASILRMCNSAPALIPTWVKNSRKHFGISKNAHPLVILEHTFKLKRKREEITTPEGKEKRIHVGGYGHYDRWKKISTWDHFKGAAPENFEVEKYLKLSADPRRPGGELLVFPNHLR